jgi:hypothetical protein
MRPALVVAAGVLLPATPVEAQAVAGPPPPAGDTAGDTAAYAPRYELPGGRQVLVVYVGMTGCGASRDPELKAAVRRMKPLLARQAAARGAALSVSGVALDWQADSGVAYLKGLGAWDEMTVGNNWVNLGAERHIWRARDNPPNIPQVLVYERAVTPGDRGIAFTAERRVARFAGVPEITAWVARGAPLPGAAVRPRTP